MSAYRVGIADFGDSFGACVFDLPGCWINGRDREELLGLAPLAIAQHVSWLLRGGRTATSLDHPQIEIVEEVRSANEIAVEGEFCFKDDLRFMTDDVIAEGIRVMELSRVGLLDVLGSCSDAVLDWRPPRSAMVRLDPWKPDALTIREIAADVANAEAYYRTGLSDGRGDAGAEKELRDAALQRQRLVAALRGLSPPDRGRRFEPIRTWHTAPEHWTLRKVIRRVISHERFHTAEIRQRLAWLQLGVPRFGDD